MNTTPRSLTIDSVHRVLSTWSGIPAIHFRATENLEEKLALLPAEFEERIFDQELAIEAAVNALRRTLILKRDLHDRRPRAVLLFVGPTGVGKTELACSLAEVFYGDAQRYLKRIDMSEFTEEHTVARLVGAPPGYIGYGRGGQLTNALKEGRHGVLLLDEVEKAHPKVLTDALLPLVGEGIIHDMNTGELVDAQNFLVVMTSNLGANPHQEEGRRLGFHRADYDYDPQDDFHEAVRKALPHEFLGRIDQIVIFQPLSESAAERIWRRELTHLEGQLTERYGEVRIAVDALAERIFIDQARQDVPTQGARAIRKTFEEATANPCIDVMAGAGLDRGPWRIEIAVSPEGEIRFKRSSPVAKGERES